MMHVMRLQSSAHVHASQRLQLPTAVYARVSGIRVQLKWLLHISHSANVLSDCHSVYVRMC
jgi:hypothetical protein